MASLLFERLAKSRDKKGALALANEGQVLTRPQDAIKDPYVLEFLDLPEAHRLVESRAEEALIGKMQAFLLELGFGGEKIRKSLEGETHTHCREEAMNAMPAAFRQLCGAALPVLRGFGSMIENIAGVIGQQGIGADGVFAGQVVERRLI